MNRKEEIVKIYNIIRLAGFIGVWLFLLQSCKDEEQLNSKFEIEGTALQQSLDGNASTVVVQVKTTLPMSDWQVESDASVLVSAIIEYKRVSNIRNGECTLADLLR